MNRTVSSRAPRVASSETAREINHDTLLRLVLLHQPISRADLARRSGLQRSTVSVIVDQLIREGWVLEGALGKLPRGRRPTILHANDQHVVLAVDLRPDTVHVAAVNINGEILHRETVRVIESESVNASFKHVVQEVGRIVRAYRKTFKDRILDKAGVSVAGRVSWKTRELLFAPNMRWGRPNLFTELEKAMGMPIVMDNAANTAVMAQKWQGDYAHVSNMVSVSVSEGIGAGILVNGNLVSGMEDMAGEFGHIPLDPDGPRCGCGNRGCWEMMASNRAALRYYQEENPKHPITCFADIVALAQEGDVYALRAIDRMAYQIGRGMFNIVTSLAPEVIVVVGDCAALWGRIGPLVESYLTSQSLSRRIPKIVAALDGDAARLRGAAVLVWQRVLLAQHSSAEGAAEW
jgi:predicted NBD/HSP70 family sugar kinase